MVKFTQNGIVIALAEVPNWVRVMENGAYGLCRYEDAEGVVIDGKVYSLPGYEISEHGEITIEMAETGAYVFNTDTEIGRALTEQELNNIAAQQEITELELMILEG